MTKQGNINDPGSCWNRAKDDEPLFILLGRDKDAPTTIRDWIEKRIARGKNKIGDVQMVNAEICANQMTAYAEKVPLNVTEALEYALAELKQHNEEGDHTTKDESIKAINQIIQRLKNECCCGHLKTDHLREKGGCYSEGCHCISWTPLSERCDLKPQIATVLRPNPLIP